MLEKIAKLLNQAENAGTEAEAAAFMERAQKLATIHSIDLARARHATKEKERTLPVQRTIHIGEHGTRGLRTLTDLYLGIAAANDIEVTIASNATRVYAYGFAEDVDVSEALFASLLTQQAKALDAFKRNGEWRNETIYTEARWGGRYKDEYKPAEYKPQTWLTARLNFQDAYASRIRSRLRAAKMDEQDRIRKAEADVVGKPHLTDDGVLNQHFVDWFAEREGLSLLDDDQTAAELTEQFIAMTREAIGGDVWMVTGPDTAEEWLIEILSGYVQELDGAPKSSGMELVLASKREAVAEFYAPARAQARGSYRGGTSGASSYSGQSAGRSAADRASLGRSTAIGGTKGAISA